MGCSSRQRRRRWHACAPAGVQERLALPRPPETPTEAQGGQLAGEVGEQAVGAGVDHDLAHAADEGHDAHHGVDGRHEQRKVLPAAAGGTEVLSRAGRGCTASCMPPRSAWHESGVVCLRTRIVQAGYFRLHAGMVGRAMSGFAPTLASTC